MTETSVFDWHQLFLYQDDGKIVWKEKRSQGTKAGDVAGSLTSKGYRRVEVSICGKSYSISIHRIIWEMFNGPIPSGAQVDHIDGDRGNNRVQNLRLANPNQNAWNRGISKANTSGYKGVSFEKSSGKWLAQIRTNGIARKIGRFMTKEDAAQAYREADIQCRGNFSACQRY
jgi:hypothetical protein